MLCTTLARRLLLVSLMLVMANSAVLAQNHSRIRGIPGYLDPLTGEFRSMMPAVQQDAEAPAASTFGGTFTFTLTTTVSSTIASTTKLVCEANALVSDSNGTYEEAASVSVTRGTGATVTCTMKIPYLWLLNTGTSDQVFTSYSISTATSSTSPVPQRLTSHSFPPMAVPANGANTAINFSPTI